ncbi:hypothetical protein J3E64_001611 [Sphingobium sp. OAS761]|uniref:DUF6456 domain-containing protein n=1 Tax=Sphingobium sp. OAS761 TaxID=2817901 RepID=UPI00209FD51D|nr:DUF6456 domain-containing protein [Sphingobium sp. OAS761]MCP1469924.1 hypothetical protein [Sphingobium sp. OAS761]
MTNHVEHYVEGPDGRSQRVQVHLGESPLAWLHARGHISQRQYAAGDKLREDWERAGLGPRVTMRWDGAPRTGGRRGPALTAEPGHARLSARARFDGALAAAGPGLSDILWRVVCAGEGLGAAEKALGWPVRAGKLVLTMALDRVAGWYRVP